MKKFFILFLCLLAVFAIVSCKNEPKQEEKPAEPKPTDEDILSGKAYYRLTATIEAKRFSFMYVGGEDGINPKEGDVLSITYRPINDHPVTHLYLKNAVTSAEVKFLDKYVIQSEEDPYVTVNEDGWITMSFTYPAAPLQGSYDPTDGTVSGFLLELANYDYKFAPPNDYIEIKELSFNGTKLVIEGPETVKEAEKYQSNHGIWSRGKGDQTEPVLTAIFFE